MSSARFYRSTTPRALYYSSACHLPLRSRVSSRVPQHRAPYITQAPATSLYARVSPRAFHNTTLPILLKRLPPPFTLACLLARSTTPRALYYSSACHLPLRSRVSSRVPQRRAPYITQAPATSLYARVSSARLYRSTTPRALYYSSACHLPLRSRVSSRVPQHRAPYITQAPATSLYARVSSARLYRSTTPRALYYSSACHLPLRSRELRSPLSFHNTARPILLKRLSPPFPLA